MLFLSLIGAVLVDEDHVVGALPCRVLAGIRYVICGQLSHIGAFSHFV